MDLAHNTTTQEYIEVIGDLERENRVARVKDIADRRGVSRSSVSNVLNQLMEKDLVAHEQYGHVTLTDQGRRLAKTLARRHRDIKDFLTKILNIPDEIAEQEACQMEHIMSRETLIALNRFVKFVHHCPFYGGRFTQMYRDCGKYGEGSATCRECESKDRA